MFTVSPDAIRPSPRPICSFKVTVPMPGMLICVFGDCAPSPSEIPFTTRPTNAEPAPLMLAVLPLLALLARPATAFAVIRPLRILTFCNVELLCAVAAFSPITPVVIEPSDSAARTPGTPRLAAAASAMPDAGSSITRGDSASRAVVVWTKAPKASPAMLFEYCATAGSRRVSTNPASRAKATAQAAPFAEMDTMLVPPGLLDERLQIAARQESCVEVHG